LAFSESEPVVKSGNVTYVAAISTMAMINQVYDGQVGSLRQNELQKQPLSNICLHHDGDKNYAPEFVWKNKNQFDYLLNHLTFYHWIIFKDLFNSFH